MVDELYRTEDEHGLILVSQQGDKRVLSFGKNAEGRSFEQSRVCLSRPYHLSHEYMQIMLLALCYVQPESPRTNLQACLLGLGGAGMVHCLHHFFPNIHLQVVELRQAVIDVSRQWFDLPEHNNLSIVCDDARLFMQSAPPHSLDIIFSDLYLQDGMSTRQTEDEFIVACRSALTESGCLVINFHQRPEADSTLLVLLKSHFPILKTCHVFRGNHIVFCLMSVDDEVQRHLLKYAKTLAKTVEMPLAYYAKQLIDLS